jgi:catechol 2,3-dioxygenase-like lactoylglutathione lyase family enzyme
MSIVRAEGVTFGVTDLAVCSRFLTDMGLQPDEPTSDSSLLFRTPVNQFIRLVPADIKDETPALAEGSAVREVMWGVDTAESLEAIAKDLQRDYSLRRDRTGAIHTIDPVGFGLGFMLSKPVALTVDPAQYNVNGQVERWNRGQAPSERPLPLKIIHVALNITKATQPAARAFYTERLRFKTIDEVDGVGVFLQCEGDIQHHNLFLCHRPDRAIINHLAFETPDFDNVIRAGEYMAALGWKESRRLGRHIMGSNVFRFFHSPCGGRIEFAADMDRMDKSFQTRHWPKHPGHHIYMMKSPLPALEATTAD